MIYDLSNELARVQFDTYCKHLADKRCRVELTEKKGKRTLKQNRYLHLILSYFALQYGERMEWVKQEFFKRFINPDIFLVQKEGRGVGQYYILRSSADLSTLELSTAIDRFRDWSIKEAGIYLPTPEEHILIDQMEREIESNKRWI